MSAAYAGLCTRLSTKVSRDTKRRVPLYCSWWVIFPHGRRWLQGVRTCNEDSCGPDPGSRRPYTHHTWACPRSRHASYPPTARTLHHAPLQDPSIHAPVPTLRPVSHAASRTSGRESLQTASTSHDVRPPQRNRLRNVRGRRHRRAVAVPCGCGRVEADLAAWVRPVPVERWQARAKPRVTHRRLEPRAVAHPRRALCRSTSTSWTCARNRR